MWAHAENWISCLPSHPAVPSSTHPTTVLSLHPLTPTHSTRTPPLHPITQSASNIHALSRRPSHPEFYPCTHSPIHPPSQPVRCISHDRITHPATTRRFPHPATHILLAANQLFVRDFTNWQFPGAPPLDGDNMADNQLSERINNKLCRSDCRQYPVIADLSRDSRPAIM